MSDPVFDRDPVPARPNMAQDNLAGILTECWIDTPGMPDDIPDRVWELFLRRFQTRAARFLKAHPRGKVG